MIHLFNARLRRCGAAALCLTLMAGCGVLSPTTTPQPSFYSLDSARVEARAATGAPTSTPTSEALISSSAAPTLIVNPTHATAGFDSQRIIYTREAHKLEYFAHSEWVDTPARMIAPLIVAALENSGNFRAVVLTPSAAAGDLRLDTEILRLQHNFSGPANGVRFTLRAYMVDNQTRQVLAWREFDESVAAASEDPYGGVVAANRAVQVVLGKLASFCAEVAGNWKSPSTEVPKRSEENLRPDKRKQHLTPP